VYSVYDFVGLLIFLWFLVFWFSLVFIAVAALRLAGSRHDQRYQEFMQ
jgi:hypothetical protein